jgi:C_GCAxxG_C_C family probable redox protein
MSTPVSRSLELFRGGLFCSEAIVQAFNSELGLGLDAATLRVASAFGAGFGGAKCSCGSLTGAQIVLGSLLGRTTREESVDRLFPLAKELHDSFRSRFGQVCCRGLTRKLPWGEPEHHAHCEQYVTGAAQLLWDMLLAQYHLIKGLQYRGKHTLALFELVWPWRGKGVTGYSIPQLMEQLSLAHTRYSYGQLKLRVLEPAFTEIYAWDQAIHLRFGPSFSGRRVEGIWFEVTSGAEARELRRLEPTFRVAEPEQQPARSGEQHPAPGDSSPLETLPV